MSGGCTGGGACNLYSARQLSSVQQDNGENTSFNSTECVGNDTSGNESPLPLSSGKIDSSTSFLCIPCLRFYDGNTNAVGFAIDSSPRGVIVVGAAVFVSTSLIRLAEYAAGCATEIPEGETEIPECTNRVYGMRPSSLITTIQLIVSVIVAILMPLVGAIIDHTKYRKTVGQSSAFVITVSVFTQIFISQSNWFFMVLLQVVVAVTYCVHANVTFAYLPELTKAKDKMLRYYGSFTVAQFGSTLLFLALMVVLTTLLQITDDVLNSARLSQMVVFIVCLVFFGYSWIMLFEDRPASQTVPEGSSLLTAGFKKIFATTCEIRKKYPAIKWTLVGVALSEPAVGTFMSIAITFLNVQLQFTPTENGTAILILLTASIPGSMISTWVTKKINPIRSLQVVLIIWMVTTTLAAWVLVGSGQQAQAYMFTSIWGIATGWYFPTERAVYCTIIPKKQDAELMGLYLCACQIIGWLPPLIFTAMNEIGVSMRLGVIMLDVFFLASFLVYFLVGDYDKAVEHARKNDTNHEDLIVEIPEGHNNGCDTTLDTSNIVEERQQSPAFEEDALFKEEEHTKGKIKEVCVSGRENIEGGNRGNTSEEDPDVEKAPESVEAVNGTVQLANTIVAVIEPDKSSVLPC
eukprot:CAMPEP_0195517902 /NCGR_PEP_ID=MMETSP0794_2-20130614/11810_1 /TAXON_ID=515487 /ORGANISM="Stephanopyxis turris, Strain CCMP 815" /LENGTH=632 /DNA_ID=CAMNT_0040646779 /DNA_START=140 /DNA_END=2038 /DNA_ORIENTATION=+